MKKHFTYLSRDGATNIHAIEWIPDQDVKAVLQISHGMVEYIDRYDDFARYLNRHGFYVTGNDHLGHGLSVQRDSLHGYFHKTKGNECVIGDIHRLRKIYRVRQQIVRVKHQIAKQAQLKIKLTRVI